MRRVLALLVLSFVACHPTASAPQERSPTVSAPGPTTPGPGAPPTTVPTARVESADAAVTERVAPPTILPATVEQISVTQDSPAAIVRGAPGTTPHIVFMPGVCSNAYAYLLAFPNAARAHGGVVAIDGDQPCPGVKGFHSFSWNPLLQRARIERALAAAGQTVPEGGLTLVGYSAGASIAEMMQQRWPELFTHLVLIAPPGDPSPARLRKAHAVVAMSCSYDVPARMKTAARALERIEVPSTYLEMPKCTHGNIADGERVFDDAFRWLEARP